jgi:hypothetical protein
LHNLAWNYTEWLEDEKIGVSIAKYPLRAEHTSMISAWQDGVGLTMASGNLLECAKSCRPTFVELEFIAEA